MTEPCPHGMANANETVCQRQQRLLREAATERDIVRVARLAAEGLGIMLGVVTPAGLPEEDLPPRVSPKTIDYGKR